MALLIYGATGYTGALVAAHAVERGLRPVLAGRRADAVVEIGRRLGMDHRVFALDHPAEVERALAGVTTVLSCAGPFSQTAAPLVDACLRARAHYLDITGEVAVFAAVAARDAEARAAGVTLLPGAGFDVVPSDCLAAHLHRRLPSATHLELAFTGTGSPSRGTSVTALEGVGQGGLVRRDGALTPVPAGHRTITVDFGDGAGPRKAMAIPWGDVFTAHVTTGIPNIEVFLAAGVATRLAWRATRVVGPLLARPAVQRALRRLLATRPAGPSDDERRDGRATFWGRAHDAAGRSVESRLVTPNGYELTRLAAVDLAARALAGDLRPGYQTPARACGPDYILGFPAVTLSDGSP